MTHNYCNFVWPLMSEFPLGYSKTCILGFWIFCTYWSLPHLSPKIILSTSNEHQERGWYKCCSCLGNSGHNSLIFQTADFGTMAIYLKLWVTDLSIMTVLSKEICLWSSFKNPCVLLELHVTTNYIHRDLSYMSWQVWLWVVEKG